jgi:hypothetical protein
MSAEVDVRTWLTGTASVLASSAVFIGKTRPAGGAIPSKSIWIATMGGWQPRDVIGGVSTAEFTRTVQVRIRSAANDYAGGAALADAAHQRMHRGAIPGYLSVVCWHSAPMYIGLDDQEENEWSFWTNLWSEG